MKIYDAWEELKETVRTKAHESNDTKRYYADERLVNLGETNAYFHVLRLINEMEEKHE